MRQPLAHDTTLAAEARQIAYFQQRPQESVSRYYLLPDTHEPVNLASPEDVILNKLAWYVLGNYVSDQQWRDVQALLRVQGDTLDSQYLRDWASALAL